MRDLVLQAYRAGLSMEEVARRTGCSPPLVHQLLAEAGVVAPRRGRAWPYDPTAERHLAVAYAAGATMADLVRRFGGSNRALRVVLEHRGVPVRPSGRPAG